VWVRVLFFLAGEICEEWSEDEDAPTIRVRWLFTASQVSRTEKKNASCVIAVCCSDSERGVGVRVLELGREGWGGGCQI
jgi:hypothetical protein